MRFHHLGHDAVEVISFRRLEWRKLPERFQMLKPQLLTNRQHVPVVDYAVLGAASDG